MKTSQQELFSASQGAKASENVLRLVVTLNYAEFNVVLVWSRSENPQPVISAWMRVLNETCLEWTTRRGRKNQTAVSHTSESAIRARLKELAACHPISSQNFEAMGVSRSLETYEILSCPFPPLAAGKSPWEWLAEKIYDLVRDYKRYGGESLGGYWVSRAAERLAAEQARLEQNQAAVLLQRREREEKQAARERRKLAERQAQEVQGMPSMAAQAPLPSVPVRIELPEVEFQETALPLGNLNRFTLQEKAALWWVSNQTDSLLCLPYCRIERLEYQVRTALRVLGPLRGRALLSDEVGLGKTIEAGLVLKELLTRGMVKRFLVLTVPSLVDQWEEELSEKFGLEVVTTNDNSWRDSAGFCWEDNSGIVASLHTLKQPAHLDRARQIKWDMLIVDEAHYLRNRESQAWQAVSALPRQFLLLLTATPVQNSLEELYNLVTLLQPGQLPAPREFRSRFIEPKQPRRPREPEELRRLLGQVMIRNTRANAGLKLPPRRAETVLFAPGAGEREFWEKWETEFRKRLERLSASQGSLWGRLLLQAGGSSPAAWRAALEKFPDAGAVQAWRRESPLEESWRRKCELLVPLTRGEGGVVVFSQFLETQAALAQALKAAGAAVFVINGVTPAAERQPLTEEFRRAGGALLLTHSGTEGRNLQFCHRLVNFDLPWNPMEIEQRIGRLHRYGQLQPVRIYNFTQEGTLQQQLLEVLQEKLNLFELVIGETGLVLGERFDSDAFAEEVLRRWRDNEGKVAEAIAGLGEELASARGAYDEIKRLDQTLFADDYASDL
ncbi:MAG TPA: SNF2-related protein [Candidatus Limnocylindrales bacterium]|nr:SNF2-related protein [Candidatus Limnocylindrales bacterium]